MVSVIKSSQHYSSPDLIERITVGLREMGKTPETVTIDDLSYVDEFHVRGAVATQDIIQLLQSKSNDRLIDQGSGLGGPARRIASTVGCHVTGIDLSPDYRRTAKELTKWVSLDGSTDFELGSVTDLSAHADDSFDGAYSIHVAMNVEDRVAFYSEVSRVLKTGARFVMYDIVLSKENAPMKYPQPWSPDIHNSFLKTEDQMLTALEDAGFEIEHTRDDSVLAVEFLKNNNAKIQKFGPPPLSLVTVLGPVAKEAIPNLAQNFIAGSLRVLAVSAIKK